MRGLCRPWEAVRIACGTASWGAVVLFGASGPPSASASPQVTRVPSVPVVQIHAERGLERMARDLVSDSAVWRSFPGIGGPSDALPDTIHIWVARELSEAVPAGLREREAWVAGVARPAAGWLALRVGENLQLWSSLAAVLRHELAHIALYRATGGNSPRWLSEGYAQLASGRWGAEEAWRLRLVFLRRGGESLRNLDLRFTRVQPEAQLGYLLSYTAVRELTDLGGEAGLRAVFGRLRGRATFDVALREVYGLTEQQFEARWKRSVVDRYGWLYVLSRAAVFWFAVSVLVIFVSVRRARRDRARLAALRAAEAAEEAGADAALTGQE